jgi:hypothetical protein
MPSNAIRVVNDRTPDEVVSKIEELISPKTNG